MKPRAIEQLICYYRIEADGTFLKPVWLTAPVVAMIHDFAVTEKWVSSDSCIVSKSTSDIDRSFILGYFPVIPQVCDIERMKQAGEHWQWSPETRFCVGVLPRRGVKSSDLKVCFPHPIFCLPPSNHLFPLPVVPLSKLFSGHVANAYEYESGNIVLDLELSVKNVFFWWPDAQGNSPEPSSIHSQLTRFIIDPNSEELDLMSSTVLQSDNSEFYRIDDRFATQPYKHRFFDLMDIAIGTDLQAIMPQLGGGYPLYNALAHLNIETEVIEIYSPGHIWCKNQYSFRNADLPLTEISMSWLW